MTAETGIEIQCIYCLQPFGETREPMDFDYGICPACTERHGQDPDVATATRPAATLVEQLETLPDELGQALREEFVKRTALEVARADLAELESDHELTVRSLAAEAGEKVTEGAVAARVSASEAIRQQRRLVREREHEYRYSLIALQVLDVRRRTLHDLVQLQVGGRQ